MGLLEALTAMILGWQVVMPAIDNGKYMLWNLPNGKVVLMNTQDGSMVPCDIEKLTCDVPKKEEETKKEPITDVVDYR